MNQQVQISPADLVLSNEAFFSGALTTDQIAWKKESQFAIQSLGKNDYLFKAALSNQASFQNAIINIAAIGISLNPALKHAYLVPRSMEKGKPPSVCLDVSYQGLMHLAMQSGGIVWGQAKIVYKNDKYTNNGIDKAPTHEQDTFGDKGLVVGVYCTVKTKDGDYLTEEMDHKSILEVQNASQAKNGPWKNWWNEMARKTVVKRASKYWPSCDNVASAIEVINQHEGINFDEPKDITPPKRTTAAALAENIDSVRAINQAFEEEKYHDMIMYWDEISGDPDGDINAGENDKTLLWIAPTKCQQYGLKEPIFSTEVRKFIKEEASQYR
jgi:recombination protein RecT